MRVCTYVCVKAESRTGRLPRRRDSYLRLSRGPGTVAVDFRLVLRVTDVLGGGPQALFPAVLCLQFLQIPALGQFFYNRQKIIAILVAATQQCVARCFRCPGYSISNCPFSL